MVDNRVAAPLDYRRAIGPGHNVPPVDPVETAREAVDQLITNTERWLAEHQVITDAAAAAACEDWANQLKAHYDKCDEIRVTEKRPHDEAAAAVQSKWNPILARLKICRDAIVPLRRTWLALEQRRLDAERAEKQREAAEAALRARQLIEAARAKQIGPGSVTNQILAKEAAIEAKQAAKVAAAVPVKAQQHGNLGGRASSLREYWFAEVVDWQECFSYFHEPDPDNPGQRQPVESLRKELTRLANEKVRHGIRDLPGCVIDRDER